jgi:peroxiredoxin
LKNKYNIIAFILCFGFMGPAFTSAPNFTLQTLKGSGSVSLSSLRGKVVLIDFWASFCEPCRFSFPAYNQLLARFQSQGFTILGINQDREASDARGFLDKVPANFTILADPDAVATKLFNPPTMPTAYLIDRNGNLVKTYEGYHQGDEDKIAQDIENYLGKGHAASTKDVKAKPESEATKEPETPAPKEEE